MITASDNPSYPESGVILTLPCSFKIFQNCLSFVEMNCCNLIDLSYEPSTPRIETPFLMFAGMMLESIVESTAEIFTALRASKLESGMILCSLVVGTAVFSCVLYSGIGTLTVMLA